MNSSFGTSSSARRSIHSAFGMYPSVTPNAGYSFSIFPRTMPTVYAKYNANQITVQAAAYAGASTSFDENPYNLRWNLDESVYLVGEIHYKNNKRGAQTGLYKLGFFYHSSDFPDVTQVANLIRGNRGCYLIADHMLLPESDHPGQGLKLFAQISMASGNQNLLDLYNSAGFTYQGLLPQRDQDVLFFGMVNSFINQELQEVTGAMESNRAIVEMNYTLTLGNYLTLQPNLQYIVNPGADPTLENALLGMLRFSIKY